MASRPNVTVYVEKNKSLWLTASLPVSLQLSF